MLIWSYLGVILIGIVPVAFKTVHYYAEPGFPWHTYITTYVGELVGLMNYVLHV